MKNGVATETAATGAILIEHEVGLHARPSVKLTKLAKTFASKIELGLSGNGPWIDAKSIVKVMAFRAAKGSTLHFRAHGGDAHEAVAALVELVRRGFDEGHGGG
ncbi:HPr family phosphocarrier protein [Dongia deserti]|uniref:HPr family phosphocarrier protein n=1 Tax=Dongia deserti TaxID=2268030 RepID=UPI000E64B781|nr:HPr family phosphocarrier protein [Dongia deserti]